MNFSTTPLNDSNSRLTNWTLGGPSARTEVYDYDPYANMKSITINGSTTSIGIETVNGTPTNRLASHSYDTAGNLTDPYTDQQVSYDALGCSISQATASVLSDLVIGRTVAEGMKLHNEFLALMQSQGEGEPDEEVLGDAVAFAGVSKYPARIKCALLAWMAWKDATAQAMGEREPA